MIKATYENIPTGSMQNSTTTGTNAQSFVNWNDFKTQRTVIKYATLEEDRWLLDGTFTNFPDSPTGLGYISTVMSDSNGDFSQPIVITRTYTLNYTSPGIMIEFDSNTNDFGVNINVKWYIDSTLISNMDFVADSATYFCDNPVTAYNKVVITIQNVDKPYHFLKIFNIADGIVREFYDEELENVELIEQVDPANKSLSINQLSMQILPKNTKGILFQRTLPLKIYRNDVLYGDFFISKSKSNTSKTIYNITADDYIKVLDGQSFLGGLYSNVTASTLISNVMENIPYSLDSSLQNKTLSGYMPITSRREALRIIAFALNALIDTSRSDMIIIKPYPTTVSSTISKNRIVNIETTEENIITKFELSYVTYKPNSEITEIFNNRITDTSFITFSEPMHDLNITNGTIVNSNINYAIIQSNGNSNVVLSGQGYDEVTQTYSKSNPYTVSTDIEKIDSVETTLVNNIQSNLNFYKFKQFKIKSKFNLNNERVGDLIDLAGQQARITSINYDLSQKDIYATVDLEAYYG